MEEKEKLVEEANARLTKVPSSTKEPLKMVSLKQQLSNDRKRLVQKITKRRIKAGPKLPAARYAPRVPYNGKDKFSGQNKQFADRIEMFDSKDKFGRDIHRLYYADNNKYYGNGKLKD